MVKGTLIALCLILVLSVVVDAQKDSKWAWTSKDRNNVDESRDRQSDRRKFEAVEDFRDRYEVSEQTTRRPNSQGDEFFGNTNSLGGSNGNSIGNGVRVAGSSTGSRLGFIDPNGVTGNGYNSNGFGPFGPQGLGAPNNFNYPPYGNQFNGPAGFNPGFGYPNNNNLGPGFNNNFYPNGGRFPPNYANGPYYPGGFGPNRYPYNPLGNSAGNGVLVGPGGPTGVYGRPPNYIPPNIGQNAFNGGFAGGPSAPGGLFNNNFGGPLNGQFPINGGFPSNGQIGPNGPFPPIPFNSRSGAGIAAQSDEPKGKDLHKNSNE